MGGEGCDKNLLVKSGQKQHYNTINEIIYVNILGGMCYLSNINKVFIILQPYNQHFYNIYKFNYIVWSNNKYVNSSL